MVSMEEKEATFLKAGNGNNCVKSFLFSLHHLGFGVYCSMYMVCPRPVKATKAIHRVYRLWYIILTGSIKVQREARSRKCKEKCVTD